MCIKLYFFKWEVYTYERSECIMCKHDKAKAKKIWETDSKSRSLKRQILFVVICLAKKCKHAFFFVFVFVFLTILAEAICAIPVLASASSIRVRVRPLLGGCRDTGGSPTVRAPAPSGGGPGAVAAVGVVRIIHGGPLGHSLGAKHRRQLSRTLFSLASGELEAKRDRCRRNFVLIKRCFYYVIAIVLLPTNWKSVSLGRSRTELRIIVFYRRNTPVEQP